MKNEIFKMLLLALIVSVASCGESSTAADQKSGETTEQAEQGKEYTSKYICPMHCEGSGSEEPGKCPVCGMDYVLNENN
ncbi:MAG: heavy metal-binding domain-containing protein [Saprospiraceae bacterium]|jgi:predicted nucleic acid binding AN1-type Zn finger protein